MMGTPTRHETVTKTCKNCKDLFRADIDGTGRCLDEFCSVMCERDFHDEMRRRGHTVTHKTYCEKCAKTNESKWNGASSHNHHGNKMWSGFLRHIRGIHCGEGEYPIDLDEKPQLYVYEIETERWLLYDEDTKYWNEVQEENVPTEILEEHDE